MDPNGDLCLYLHQYRDESSWKRVALLDQEAEVRKNIDSSI
jgi:hypothetical protein